MDHTYFHDLFCRVDCWKSCIKWYHCIIVSNSRTATCCVRLWTTVHSLYIEHFTVYYRPIWVLGWYVIDLWLISTHDSPGPLETMFLSSNIFMFLRRSNFIYRVLLQSYGSQWTNEGLPVISCHWPCPPTPPSLKPSSKRLSSHMNLQLHKLHLRLYPV